MSNMPIQQATMIVESLPSLYPLQSFEEEALQTVLTAQPEQRWIPCNERLPEEDGEYLVTVKSDYMHYTTKAWFFVKYKIWNKQYDEGGYEARITAWMPTPEPYREEDGS